MEFKLIGWKQVCFRNHSYRREVYSAGVGAGAAEYAVVQLGIPIHAVISETAPKKRCSEAVVLAIKPIKAWWQAKIPKTAKERKTWESLYTGDFLYTLGETVKPMDFNSDLTVQCGAGIHFYLTKEEAINHY
jgi:hypothetical protein